MVELPQAERDILQTAYGEVGREWAASLDARGLPGTEVFDAFTALQ